jgi:hypothetical protein
MMPTKKRHGVGMTAYALQMQIGKETKRAEHPFPAAKNCQQVLI